MESGDKPPLDTGILLPDNLEDVIAHDLVPSGYPGGDTEKYFVRGYPDLLVRHNNGGELIDTLRETATVYNELSQYGIDAPPYVPVEVDGEPYVVTLNVTGESLADMLESGAALELAPLIDDLWAKLANYILDRKQHDKPYAMDIYAPGQYTYGTIAGENDPHLWLVDLGLYAWRFSEPPSYQLEAELLHMVNTVLSLESKTSHRFLRSRAAIGSALNTLPVPRFKRAGRTALRTRTPINLPDDIDDL